MRYITTFLLIVFGVNVIGQITTEDSLNNQRILKAKKSTVRILIDNQPVGTGFYINNAGFVCTCFHVIANKSLRMSHDTIISKIEIENYKKEKYEVIVPIQFSQGILGLKAKLYDFIVLEPKAKLTGLTFLKFGNFKDVKEGQRVYTCGYPFGVEQSITTFGIVSSIWQQAVKVNDSLNVLRDVAWIDISSNKGNSGGAVIALADNPEDDLIIGIETFSLNVFSQYAEKIKALAQNKNVKFNMGGLNYQAFAELTAMSIESGFYGIGGLVSIQYLDEILVK